MEVNYADTGEEVMNFHDPKGITRKIFPESIG